MLKKPKSVQKVETTKEYRLNKSQLQWLEALESGDYKRTTDSLCHIHKNGTESYCCLGVACELFSKKSEIVKDGNDESKSYYGEAGVLPDELMPKLKLHGTDGTIYTDEVKTDLGGNKCLTELNDSGWSFKKIAGFIRKNPTAVFE